MKGIKRLSRLVVNHWRPALVILGALLCIITILWFKLGELPGGISQSEAVTREHLLKKDVSLSAILENPLYLPYSIALFIFQLLNINTLGALRSISAFIGLGTIIAFYLLLRRWHTTRMATLGTILFGTSSWFLHTARFGGVDILFSVLIIFLFAGVWLQHSSRRAALLSLLLFCGAMTLYVPGMVWFVVIGGLWQRKRLAREFREVPGWFIVTWLLLGSIFVAPLIWALIQDPGLVKPLLGFPQNFPSLIEFAKNLGTIPTQLFLQGPNNPELWLGRLPLLDFFGSVMLIIGLYWYAQRIRLDRSLFMIMVFVVGSVLVALEGPVSLIFLIPFVYLLITAGMTFMLQQWFTVFPRNPIARNIGTSLLSIAVLITAFYHINHYFIAWPHTPETRAVYQKQP